SWIVVVGEGATGRIVRRSDHAVVAWIGVGDRNVVCRVRTQHVLDTPLVFRPRLNAADTCGPRGRELSLEGQHHLVVVTLLEIRVEVSEAVQRIAATKVDR